MIVFLPLMQPTTCSSWSCKFTKEHLNPWSILRAYPLLAFLLGTARQNTKAWLVKHALHGRAYENLEERWIVVSWLDNPWRLTWHVIMEVWKVLFFSKNGWFVGSVFIFQGVIPEKLAVNWRLGWIQGALYACIFGYNGIQHGTTTLHKWRYMTDTKAT